MYCVLFAKPGDTGENAQSINQSREGNSDDRLLCRRQMEMRQIQCCETGLTDEVMPMLYNGFR
ncbi:MAG: hypothetical protein BWY82_00902 [Verrucomicrobia bacterium ADurb.Bin474]|nr:MAG: hypothetical protein BWY82_00902 [Verrucomicrobia bacterium ADurb.Bin474]